MHFDDVWRVWQDLERKENALRWGGGVPGAGLQYDSMGRPIGGSAHAGTWLGEQIGRAGRVRQALRDSGPVARQMVTQTFAGIDMSTVSHLLIAACEDFALYYGGSMIGGGVIGGIGGAFLGGASVVPGVATGVAAGGYVGGWLLALLGVKSLVEGLVHAIPAALESYAKGFNEAWGPARQDPQHGLMASSGGNTAVAATYLARGHVTMVTALLMAMMLYMTKGAGEKVLLLREIGQSKRLRPDVARWLEENAEKLRRHPALQSRQHRAQGAGPGAGSKTRPEAAPAHGVDRPGTSGSAADPGADLPMGSRHGQFNQPDNPLYQPVRNQARTVGDTNYSGHALDRMQDRGIMPSVVEDTIANGVSTASRGGTTVYYNATNNVSVVVNARGKVITVTYGGK
jgi:hypothetical protein